MIPDSRAHFSIWGRRLSLSSWLVPNTTYDARVVYTTRSVLSPESFVPTASPHILHGRQPDKQRVAHDLQKPWNFPIHTQLSNDRAHSGLFYCNVMDRLRAHFVKRSQNVCAHFKNTIGKLMYLLVDIE